MSYDQRLADVERERDALRTLWTEARVVVAQCRDANCLVSYGKAQCDAVAAANAWLDKMPATMRRTIDDASNTEWQLQRVTAERDALRAEVEALRSDRKVWMDARDQHMQEADQLRAQLAAAQEAIRKGSEDALYMRDDLLKQLAAAKADTERLDWLERQGTSGLLWEARQSTSGRGYRLHQHGPYTIAGFKTARAAIDAARKAQP